MDGIDIIIHQSIFGGEIDESFPIVFRNTASTCPKP